MIKKATIAHIIFLIAVCYIIWPWFFEKNFLFNELLSFTGLLLLIYKRFRVGADPISICVSFLLVLGGLHATFSLFRMDSFYFYLRNMVIVYSMLAFFIGYYCLEYLHDFIAAVRSGLQWLLGIFIFIPLPRIFFERFGAAILFPALFSNARYRWLPYMLIFLNIVYAITHDSFTGLVLAAFYLFLFIVPGFKFFSQVMIIGLLLFTTVFIYLQPYLSIISLHYNAYSYDAIHEVMRSNPILSIDGNSTWRLVLWKQVIVDNFPVNLAGAGFGTPLLKYFPVEDYSKLSSLPYVLGAHNSLVYLFGRLGIVYVILIVPVYITVFREYFYYKAYYYNTNGILLFWSFFAITIIALFNPALESPIYAAGYWLILGFVARSIQKRQFKSIPVEGPVHT